MSPSPDLPPQSANPAAGSASPVEPPSDQPTSAESQPEASTTVAANSSATDTSDVSANIDSPGAPSADAPVLRRPPLRPTRPQTPAQAAAAKPATTPGQSPTKLEVIKKPDVAAKPEIVSVSSVAQAPLTEADQAALRQQPIPPPSEPKQYRAIGLVRGLYTPSEEEFTRGDLQAADGTALKAVLLGRVMSLVKNHIDLQKEHLWVVYPRTREEEKELHIQIVGIWEPETLKKPEDEEAGALTAPLEAEFADPRLKDGYFSVRGEVVFVAPEEKLLVVKIQQVPRKNPQKAKAFKLAIRGELETAKAVGYFWEMHVKREDNTLTVADASCIGLAPPKRRSKDMANQGRPKRPSFGRSRDGVGKPARPSAPRTPRDPATKPIKRTERLQTTDD